MNGTSNRSSFVTVVAWIFIVLSGLGTLVSIMQNIMIQVMFNATEMEKAMHAAPPPGVPPFAAFMTSHFQLLFVAFLIISVSMLASSIGLLKRKNWARLIFICLMGLGILWNLGGLVLQLTMYSSMQSSFANVPDAADMKSFMIAMAVFSVIFALGFSVLFGWIAKRLLSPSIVTEFKQ